MKVGKLGNGNIEINIDINKLEEKLVPGILAGLEACGLQIENRASNNAPVDTGLLRNSIAHAVAGEQPSIGANYKGTGKKARTYKADNPDEKGEIKKGTYTGHVPKRKGEYKVYVGTNVYYAPYVEMGHIDAKSGAHIPAQPYLRPAFTDHKDEYEDIIKAYIREAMWDFNNQ